MVHGGGRGARREPLLRALAGGRGQRGRQPSPRGRLRSRAGPATDVMVCVSGVCHFQLTGKDGEGERRRWRRKEPGRLRPAQERVLPVSAAVSVLGLLSRGLHGDPGAGLQEGGHPEKAILPGCEAELPRALPEDSRGLDRKGEARQHQEK